MVFLTRLELTGVALRYGVNCHNALTLLSRWPL